MKIRIAFFAASAVALSACGSFAPNTNASAPVTLVGSTPQDAAGVSVVDAAPKTAVELSGIDCKNKVWNPTPTNERAIEVLKAQVKKAGKTQVKVTSVMPVQNPIAMNCWSALEAKGLAY